MRLKRQFQLWRERRKLIAESSRQETNQRFRRDTPMHSHLNDAEIDVAYRELYRAIYKAKKRAYAKELGEIKRELKKRERGGH